MVASDRRRTPIINYISGIASTLTVLVLCGMVRTIIETHDAALTITATLADHQRQLDEHERQIIDVRRLVEDRDRRMAGVVR